MNYTSRSAIAQSYAGRRARLTRMIPPEVYQLPEGLNEGDIVTLIDFDAGYFTVRRQDGREFQNIFALLVE